MSGFDDSFPFNSELPILQDDGLYGFDQGGYFNNAYAPVGDFNGLPPVHNDFLAEPPVDAGVGLLPVGEPLEGNINNQPYGFNGLGFNPDGGFNAHIGIEDDLFNNLGFDPLGVPAPAPAPVLAPAPAAPAAPAATDGGYTCSPHVANDTYGAFRGIFADSAAAKAHRRRPKHSPHAAADLNQALRERDYWVKRIYDSMVDISVAGDGPSSWQYKRFSSDTPIYDPDDLEAAAHNVFDKAIAVHQRGWTRPVIYQKVAIRGKKMDKGRESVKNRLEAICAVLQESKASVNDAIQGGLTLAKLCYNPYERKVGKKGNQHANNYKADQIKAGKAALAKKAAKDDSEDGGKKKGGAGVKTRVQVEAHTGAEAATETGTEGPIQTESGIEGQVQIENATEGQVQIENATEGQVPIENGTKDQF